MGVTPPAAPTKWLEKPANDIDATPMTMTSATTPSHASAGSGRHTSGDDRPAREGRQKKVYAAGRTPRGEPRLALPHDNTRQGGHQGGNPRLALPHNELTSWIAAPSVDPRGYLQTPSAPPRPLDESVDLRGCLQTPSAPLRPPDEPTADLRGYLQTKSAPPRVLDNGTPTVPREPEQATTYGQGPPANETEADATCAADAARLMAAAPLTGKTAKGSPRSRTETEADADCAADAARLMVAAPLTVTAAKGSPRSPRDRSRCHGGRCRPIQGGCPPDRQDGERGPALGDQAGALGDAEVKITGLLGRPGYYNKPKQQ